MRCCASCKPPMVADFGSNSIQEPEKVGRIGRSQGQRAPSSILEILKNDNTRAELNLFTRRKVSCGEQLRRKEVGGQCWLYRLGKVQPDPSEVRDQTP